MAGWSSGHVAHPVFPLHLPTVSDLHLQTWWTGSQAGIKRGYTVHTETQLEASPHPGSGVWKRNWKWIRRIGYLWFPWWISPSGNLWVASVALRCSWSPTLRTWTLLQAGLCRTRWQRLLQKTNEYKAVEDKFSPTCLNTLPPRQVLCIQWELTKQNHTINIKHHLPERRPDGLVEAEPHLSSPTEGVGAAFWGGEEGAAHGSVPGV